MKAGVALEHAVIGHAQDCPANSPAGAFERNNRLGVRLIVSSVAVQMPGGGGTTVRVEVKSQRLAGGPERLPGRLVVFRDTGLVRRPVDSLEPRFPRPFGLFDRQFDVPIGDVCKGHMPCATVRDHFADVPVVDSDARGDNAQLPLRDVTDEPSEPEGPQTQRERLIVGASMEMTSAATPSSSMSLSLTPIS